MAVQGRSLDDFQVHRIVSLLARTDMTFPQIAERMGCSPAVVATINRRYEVREYSGRRTQWTLSAQAGTWVKAS
jgi:hypothetical protein